MVKTFLTTEITRAMEFVRDLFFSVVTTKFTLLFWFRLSRVKHN